MIHDTVAYLVDHGKEVVFDAEHFFDGYQANSAYALETVKVAAVAGASSVALCDTRGGSLPSFVASATKTVVDTLAVGYPHVVVGIHTHNDSGCAEACSLLAVEAGARQVKGHWSALVNDAEMHVLPH